jgi:hypothetical protein
LNLAEWYGWKPRNSLPPEEHELAESWSGIYDSSEGQEVTAEDASEFASALARMLDDPNRTARSLDLSQKMSKALGIEVQPLFSEEVEADGQLVKELVTFCKNGSFKIW